MKSKQDWRGIRAVFAFVLSLVCCSVLLAGCSQSTDTEVPAKEEAAQGDASQKEGDNSDAQETPVEEDESADEAIDWPRECLDRHGDITVYALTELTGEQLSTLLEEQDYAWSERNQMWVKIDGSAALAVNDAEGKLLKKDEIAALGAGGVEASVSYRLVTSEYSSVKRAINNLARKIMACEDVEYLGTSGVAVVSGPSEQRCLVFASKNNEVFTVSVYSEPALAQGLFNSESGQELGTTVDEVFAALTARTPGAE